MSTLAFSIGSSTPRKLIISATLTSNLNTSQASTIKISSHQHKTSSYPVHEIENPILIRRREAIGISFCCGLLGALLPTKEAEATEAIPCELTVAPSGLAYCDKIVGSGPEAVKGQLIKGIFTI